MACTPAQLASNRANARRSTGPRTKRGKRRASRNAIKHGHFCTDVVAPGESRRLFELLRQGIIHDLQPQNESELYIVDRIAIARWKLRRLQSAEMAFFRRGCEMTAQRTMDKLADLFDDEDRIRAAASGLGSDPQMPGILMLNGCTEEVGQLSRLEQRLEYSIHRWMRELERMQKLTEKRRDLPRSVYDRLQETLEAETERLAIDRARMAGQDGRGGASTRASRQEGGETEPQLAEIEDELNESDTKEESAGAEPDKSTVIEASTTSESEAAPAVAAGEDEPSGVADRDASNMKNEPNDLIERYELTSPKLWRRDEDEDALETNPLDGMIRQRDDCAARMAEKLGVPVSTFEGMNVPRIEDEVKRIKRERGESIEGVERMVWGRGW